MDVLFSTTKCFFPLILFIILQGDSIDEKSENVQEFYHNMSDRIISHQAFKSYSSDEDRDKIMDNIEKFIMTRLYRDVFCHDRTDDESQDLKVQVKAS